MFFRKSYINQILEDLKKEKLILLVWSRQVWKTTLLYTLEEKLVWKKIYINLEDYFWKTFETKESFLQFLAFEKWIDLKEEWFLFLDEVQYLKNPESLLKALYDDISIKTKVIATGSRFWGQKKLGSSLVGRWKIIFVKTLSFLEFLELKWKNPDFLENIDFSLIQNFLEEYLIFGWYPAVVLAFSKEDKIRELKKIIDRFIEKDFLYFMQSNDLIDFKKIFQYLSLNIGNIIKTGKVTQELSISSYKIKSFLKFLWDSYLIKNVPPFFSDNSKEFSSQEEYMFLDLWLLNYIKWSFDPNLSDWKLNENFVYIQCNDINLENKVYYYNKKNGTEIDFILEKLNKKIVPIEVKSSDKLTKPRSFEPFLEAYSSQIDSFVLTTKSYIWSDYIWEKPFLFYPNYLIEKKIS